MCITTQRIRLEPSLRASNHRTQEVVAAGSLALGYSQGGKLVLQSLCIIDVPDNNVEQILLRSIAYYGVLLANQYGSDTMAVCVGEVVDYPPCVSCGQNCAGYVEEFFAALCRFVKNDKEEFFKGL